MKQLGWLLLLGLTACGGDNQDGPRTGAGNGGANVGGAQAAGSTSGGANTQAGGSTGGASSGGTSANGGSTSNAGSANNGGTPSGAGSGGGGGVIPGSAGPRFIGRFTADHSFSWSGSAIELRFSGTEISVTLNDTGNENWYEVVLDGQHQTLQAMSGEHTYPIGSGLADGPHSVLVYRRTEASWNPTRFVSFSAPESSWLPAMVPERRLELIGDSISAGYGVDGTGPECPATANIENHWNTYGAIAARNLGADLHTQAWSGAGMYRGYGSNLTHVQPIHSLYILPTDTSTAWDFSKYQPHAVIINLGTNDFIGGDPGVAFQTAYTTFLTTLRQRYPSARFYGAVGPMLAGTDYTQVKAYIQAVIDARAALGDSNIAIVEFGTQTQANGYGCEWHPGGTTNALMAAKLEAALKADLGW